MRDRVETFPATGEGQHAPRVLLVEDEPLTREALASFLEDAGFDVTATCSGDEAVILLTEDEYALLLTDISMPGEINGLGLAEHAREIHPGLPIVIVSGREGTEAYASAVTPPAAFFSKPFDVSRLVGTIGQMVREAA